MQKSHPRRKEVYFVSGIRFEKLKKNDLSAMDHVPYARNNNMIHLI